MKTLFRVVLFCRYIALQFDIFSKQKNRYILACARIRYDINPSFAKRAYRVRQHISNAESVYRKSRKGFISMHCVLSDTMLNSEVLFLTRGPQAVARRLGVLLNVLLCTNESGSYLVKLVLNECHHFVIASLVVTDDIPKLCKLFFKNACIKVDGTADVDLFIARGL